MSPPPRFGDVETRASAPRGFAASLLLLLITGILLVRHDLRPSTRAMIAGSHALLGLATATYGLRSLLRLFRLRVREFPVGWMLVLLTGVLTLVFGAARAWAPMVALHALVATTYGTSQLVPRRLAYLGAPLLGLFLTSVSWDLTTEKRPTLEPVPPMGPLLPDEGGGFASVALLPARDAARFTDPVRCTACHLKIGPSHAASAHRHAGVTNPIYLSAAQTVLAEQGPEAVTRCAGCHDVGLLAHRQVEAGIGGGPEHAATIAPGADVGVPCLACHGATRVRSQRGDGALALAVPDDPVVRADGARHMFSFWMTHVDPRSHREAMVPPGGRSSTRCGVCHQASRHDEAPPTAHPQGLAVRDVHRASAYFPGAGASGRLPLDRGPRSCADCHITPPETGHRMAAANTALAALHDDEQQLDTIARFMREGAHIGAPPPVALGVLWLDDERFELGPQFTATGAGEVEIHVVVSNEGVGHLFPGGALENTELWLELSVLDVDGNTVAVSQPTRGRPLTQPAETASTAPPVSHDDRADAGGADSGVADSGAATSGAEARGGPVASGLDENTSRLALGPLAPGHASIGRYTWSVPRAGTYRVTPKLLHQRRPAAAGALGSKTTAEPPVITVATDTEALDPETLLARYIDASAAEPAAAHTQRAAAAGAERYTQHIEVRLALARLALDRHADPDAAARALGDAKDPRAQFLRARAHLLGGRPQESAALTAALLDDFPEDPEVLRLSATAHRLQGDLETAVRRLLTLLARRPDDLAALQSIVALTTQLNDAETLEQWSPALEQVRARRPIVPASPGGDSADPAPPRVYRLRAPAEGSPEAPDRTRQRP